MKIAYKSPCGTIDTHMTVIGEISAMTNSKKAIGIHDSFSFDITIYPVSSSSCDAHNCAALNL